MKTRIALSLFLILGASLAIAQTAGLKVPDAEQFVGQPKGSPVGPGDIDRRTNEIAGLLRCPVCQGLSVSDSPAEMAVNMKGQVRELLQRGYTQDQILRYFEQSYGQFVLLKPKFQGINTLVWTLPILVLLTGGAIVYFKMRRLQSPLPSDDESEAARPDVDPDLEPYVLRVRELAYGWPGGINPKESETR